MFHINFTQISGRRVVRLIHGFHMSKGMTFDVKRCSMAHWGEGGLIRVLLSLSKSGQSVSLGVLGTKRSVIARCHNVPSYVEGLPSSHIGPNAVLT